MSRACGETACIDVSCDGRRGAELPLFIRSRYFRFVSSLSISSAHWLLLSGVRKSSSLASAYTGTLDNRFGTEPSNDALAAVYRILLRISHHARTHGATSEDFLYQASIYLDVVRVYSRLLALEKLPCIPILIARPVSARYN